MTDNPYTLGNLTDYDALFENYYTNYREYVIQKNRPHVIPDAHDVIILVIYGLIFVCSIFGNSMVCLAVMCQRDMRTVTNFYIVNLAVADLLVSLICLPLNAINGVSMAWFFGDAMCKILGYFPLIAMLVSIFTLTMIAVDRYLAICRPLKFQISVRRVVVVVILIWIVSIILAFPLLLVYDVQRKPGMALIDLPHWLASCTELGWKGSMLQDVYYVCLTIVGYILPLLVIGAAYMNVCVTLWSGIPTEEMSHTESQKLSSSSKEKSKTAAQAESRRKVARMLIVVVLIFAFCMLPLQIVNLLKVFGYFDRFDPDRHHIQLNTPFLVASLLAYLNSALNPIIYNFMSAKFRKAFRAMICCQPRSTGPRHSNVTYTVNHRMSSRRTQALSSGQTTECMPLSNYNGNYSKVEV